MDYAHVFRRDGLNHVVLTNKERVRRNGRHVTICAKHVDQSFQRRVGSGHYTVVTCPVCLSAMTALMDILEEDLDRLDRERANAD